MRSLTLAQLADQRLFTDDSMNKLYNQFIVSPAPCVKSTRSRRINAKTYPCLASDLMKDSALFTAEKEVSAVKVDEISSLSALCSRSNPQVINSLLPAN